LRRTYILKRGGIRMHQTAAGLYICSACTKYVPWPWVVKTLLYRTSTAVNKVFRCLLFCFHHLLFGFETVNNLRVCEDSS
jgi:hypothetical protein